MKAKIFGVALLAGLPTSLLADYLRRLIEFGLGLAPRHAIAASSFEFMLSAAAVNAFIGAVVCARTRASVKWCALWVGGINALLAAYTLYGFANNPLYGSEFLSNTTKSYILTSLSAAVAGWALAALTRRWVQHHDSRPAPPPPARIGARHEDTVYKLDS